VIAYDHAAAAEHVLHGHNGLVADFDNTREFIRLAANLIADHHRIAEFGRHARGAEQLLSFIRGSDSEHLFLIGDIVDFWAMSRSVYWPAPHNTVVQKILRKARQHVKVFLIPGNHDEALREYVGSSFGDITIVRDYAYTAVDGKRYFLLHGDEYDQVTTCHKWVSILGDVSYNLLVDLNRVLSLVRRKLNISGHWSLADYAKRRSNGPGAVTLTGRTVGLGQRPLKQRLHQGDVSNRNRKSPLFGTHTRHAHHLGPLCDLRAQISFELRGKGAVYVQT
jgi:UDP-2,3-diacylglucosamine pyrophosphatase LpxH